MSPGLWKCLAGMTSAHTPSVTPGGGEERRVVLLWDRFAQRGRRGVIGVERRYPLEIQIGHQVVLVLVEAGGQFTPNLGGVLATDRRRRPRRSHGDGRRQAREGAQGADGRRHR